MVCRLSLGVLVSTTKPLNDWPCNNKEARRQDQPEESATKQQNDEEGLEPDIIEYNERVVQDELHHSKFTMCNGSGVCLVSAFY